MYDEEMADVVRLVISVAFVMLESSLKDPCDTEVVQGCLAEVDCDLVIWHLHHRSRKMY